jgi:hypothetical protein
MTKDEIKLVTFILVAVLVGAAARWWSTGTPRPAVPTPAPPARGWAKPPYVFKSRKEMEKTAADAKAAELSQSVEAR